MSIFNPQLKEINCKVVYYGPALSGKTTSLLAVQDRIKIPSKAGIKRIPTGERTLFFDFLALSSPAQVKGYRTKFQVYTVPGQVLYDDVRKLLLSGVDGIVFVADSRLEYVEDSIRSLDELKLNLSKLDYDPREIPMVIQYNKRDCPTATAVKDLEKILNPGGLPQFETVATKGTGVSESFQEILRRLMMSLKDGL